VDQHLGRGELRLDRVAQLVGDSWARSRLVSAAELHVQVYIALSARPAGAGAVVAGNLVAGAPRPIACSIRSSSSGQGLVDQHPRGASENPQAGDDDRDGNG